MSFLQSLCQSSFYECVTMWELVNCDFVDSNVQSHSDTGGQYSIITKSLVQKLPFNTIGNLKLWGEFHAVNVSKFILCM